MIVNKHIKDGEERQITVAAFQFTNRKGKYNSPSIEPPNCRYLRTYGEGRLRNVETTPLEYDDFDLYENIGDGSFCYRFWKRDFHEGKESGKSFSEPVIGFSTEEAAIEQALAVFRGEEEEHVSEQLRQWREWAFWVGQSVLLKHQIKNEPQRAKEIFDLVVQLRDLVHPAARGHWSQLESVAQQALADPAYFGLLKSIDERKNNEWPRAELWTRKLDGAWRKMEKAHAALLENVKPYPKEGLSELDLTGELQTALLDYLKLLGKLDDARRKDRRQ
jgi:hypothetical protein